MSIRQGDIYWVDIKPKETVGHEQFNRRPFIIVSRTDLNNQPGQHMVVGVPCSTSLGRAGGHRVRIPAEEFIKDQGCMTQFTNSVALTDQIRSLDKSRLEQPRIGRLSQSATLAVLETGLANLFDIYL